MYYSSYVALQLGIGILVFVLIAAIFFSTLGAAALGLVLLFGLIILVGMGLSIAWARRAVTEFRGAPFPGLFGVLGVTIDPDGVPRTPDDSRGPVPLSLALERSSGWGEDPVQEWNKRPTRSPSASRGPPAERSYTCPSCGKTTAGEGTRFCRWCGAPVAAGS